MLTFLLNICVVGGVFLDCNGLDEFLTDVGLVVELFKGVDRLDTMG